MSGLLSLQQYARGFYAIESMSFDSVPSSCTQLSSVSGALACNVGPCARGLKQKRLDVEVGRKDVFIEFLHDIIMDAVVFYSPTQRCGRISCTNPHDCGHSELAIP